jgi:hypothetical protein
MAPKSDPVPHGALWTTPPAAIAQTDWRGIARFFGALYLALQGVAFLLALLTIPLGAQHGFLTVSGVELEAAPGGVALMGVVIPWVIAYPTLLPIAMLSILGFPRAAPGQPTLSLMALAAWGVLGLAMAITLVVAPQGEDPRPLRLIESLLLPGAFLIAGTWPEARRLAGRFAFRR